MFNKILLLSGGKPYYFGTVDDLEPHFQSLGLAMPYHTNPAEWILDMLNVDFTIDRDAAQARLDQIQLGWTRSPKCREISALIHATSTLAEPPSVPGPPGGSFLAVVRALVHRSFIKSYRDVVAYGVRIAM